MQGHIFTIGHSTHAIDVFLDLLRLHGVNAIVDTRSYPRSKFAPQYECGALRAFLHANEIAYIFLGKELGGRPTDAKFYDHDGRVVYSRLAESTLFQRGLERLQNGMQRFRLALLCSEENPSVCHRRLLIARVLCRSGVAVDHIRGDGTLEAEQALLKAEALRASSQMALFEDAEKSEWKSILSVLPKRRQSSFSEP